jgi:hypothetical protein
MPTLVFSISIPPIFSTEPIVQVELSRDVLSLVVMTGFTYARYSYSFIGTISHIV